MLVAPGEGILSTAPTTPTRTFPRGTDGYAKLDGTSMAAPYVAGVAALLVAQARTRADVERILFETARGGGKDPRLGAGILDARAAVHESWPEHPAVEGGSGGLDGAWLPWVAGSLGVAGLVLLIAGRSRTR
jgi:subtilisin family serine protease